MTSQSSWTYEVLIGQKLGTGYLLDVRMRLSMSMRAMPRSLLALCGIGDSSQSYNCTHRANYVFFFI